VDTPDSPARSTSAGFKRFSVTCRCPLCGTATKGCSELADGRVFCRGLGPGLRKGQVIHGFAYLGLTTDEVWGQFKPVGSRTRRAPKPGRDDPAAADAQPPPKPAHVPTLSNDDAGLRDRVYRRLLNELGLTQPHRQGLLERKLTPDEIKLRAYKSVPLFGERCDLARALLAEFGEDALQVPGVRLFESKKKQGTTYLCVYPGPRRMRGTVIPVLDRYGRMVALRVRVDQEDPRNKYRWFRLPGDQRPGAFVHWGWPFPPAELAGRTVPEVRISEGEIKVGIAALRTGIISLSLPGVGAWRLARPELEFLKPFGLRTVLLALDQDSEPKPAVYRSAMNLFDVCRDLGLDVFVERWEAARGV
jgi:hypothetical protein